MSKTYSWFSFKMHVQDDFPKEFRIIDLPLVEYTEYLNLIDNLYIDFDLLDELFIECITKLKFIDVIKYEERCHDFTLTEYLGVKMYKNIVQLPEICDDEIRKSLKDKLKRIILNDLKELYAFYKHVRKYNNEKAQNNPFKDDVPEYDKETDTMWFVPAWFEFSDKELTAEEFFSRHKQYFLTIQ